MSETDTPKTTQTITVWEQPRIERMIEVNFPLYSHWITSDYSNTYNRIDERGNLLSIAKTTRDGTIFEIEMSAVTLDHLDGSYVKGHGDCSETEFMDVFRAMVEFVESAKRLVHQCTYAPLSDGAEVEISPEMIEAGVRAYFGSSSWYDPLASDHVQKIYRAMEAAKKAASGNHH